MRIYTRVPLEVRFWRFVDKSNADGCWLWTGALDRKGYGNIGTCNTTGPKTVAAHRLSWTLANGPIEGGLHVCHRCDTPACVNPAHMFLGTHTDNMRDCSLKGRVDRVHRAKGERHGNATLTNEIVTSVRTCFAAGMKQIDIARKHGLTRSAVYRLVHNKAWAHLPKAS